MTCSSSPSLSLDEALWRVEYLAKCPRLLTDPGVARNFFEKTGHPPVLLAEAVRYVRDCGTGAVQPYLLKAAQHVLPFLPVTPESFDLALWTAAQTPLIGGARDDVYCHAAEILLGASTQDDLSVTDTVNAALTLLDRSNHPTVAACVLGALKNAVHQLTLRPSLLDVEEMQEIRTVLKDFPPVALKVDEILAERLPLFYEDSATKGINFALELHETSSSDVVRSACEAYLKGALADMAHSEPFSVCHAAKALGSQTSDPALKAAMAACAADAMMWCIKTGPHGVFGWLTKTMRADPSTRQPIRQSLACSLGSLADEMPQRSAEASRWLYGKAGGDTHMKQVAVKGLVASCAALARRGEDVAALVEDHLKWMSCRFIPDKTAGIREAFATVARGTPSAPLTRIFMRSGVPKPAKAVVFAILRGRLFPSGAGPSYENRGPETLAALLSDPHDGPYLAATFLGRDKETRRRTIESVLAGAPT